MSAIRLARGFTGRSKVVKFAGCYHGHVDCAARRGRLGRRDARPARHPGRDGGVGRRHDRRALQRPRRRARGLRRRRRRDRLRHHRGGGAATWASSRRSPASTPASPSCASRSRRAAHQRRGDDRLPGLAGRLVRPRRRAARPDDLRQGDGRRLPGGGLRRSRRRDGAGWRRPAPSTRRARCRGTRSRPPPGWRRCGTPTTRSTPTSTRRPPQLGGAGVSTALSAAGVAHRLQHAGNMFSVFFSDGLAGGASPTTTAHGARTPTGSPRSSTRCSTRGVYLPPSAFEAWFVSAAHDDDALARVADALPAAARAAAAARPER